MKLFIIYVAAVLALVKAGQIPPEATVHQATVSVPVPLTVLAPPLVTEPEPATVQEVTKDHKPNAGHDETTVKQEIPITSSPHPVTTIKSTDSSSTDSSSTAATMNPCDLLCTKFEFEPICATNGLCAHEFPNQCILETYNCKHSTQKFTATKNDRCQMPGLAKCNENDMI